MADQTQQEKPAASTKNLIASFEKGEMTQNNVKEGAEKPLAKPGAAKKLQKVYEDKSKPDPAAAISKASTGAKKPATTTVGAPAATATSKKAAYKVLVVFAHWEKKSFNGMQLQNTVNVLEKAGHKVTVSDLYAMKWNPCPSQADIKDLEKKESFNYLDEMAAAVQKGNLADDLAAEHKKLKEADLVVFQFPLNWYSYPAIMKGWLDRCLTNKFAFNTEAGQLFDQGLMKGKKAVLSFTTGGARSAYTDDGIDGDINVILWPMHYTLRFSGFDVLAPQISYNITHVDKEGKQKYLASWGTRLQSIFEEKSLKFINLEDFDTAKGLMLAKDSKALKDAKDGMGLTVGQNLGKVYPPESMTKAS